MSTSIDPIRDEPSLMLVGTPPTDGSWKMEQTDAAVTYRSAYGSVTLQKNPFEIQFRDASGKLLTSTQNKGDLVSFSAPVPFSFVRRATRPRSRRSPPRSGWLRTRRSTGAASPSLASTSADRR